MGGCVQADGSVAMACIVCVASGGMFGKRLREQGDVED